MTLIKSISGIRGTIGGTAGENLSPEDIVKFASAYGKWLQNSSSSSSLKVVIGRDARVSGPFVQSIVQSTLCFLGIDIIDLGLSTTPTVEMAVTRHKADGGIVITASHNPAQWNALKLLNNKGEFISGEDGEELLKIAEGSNIEYASFENMGSIIQDTDAIDLHINSILILEEVLTQEISNKKYKVVVDAINSTGVLSVPPLLEKLGIAECTVINDDCSGMFAHNPEPLPKNLTDLSNKIREQKADIGISVDPDVDRLVFVDENGEVFGEEYTLVAVADYLLSIKSGNTVSNLSSSRALRDVTESHGGKYYPSAVGEVNVVSQMKACDARIGGEGNGGVIYPGLHYGRDALVGIALFLSHLAKLNCSVSELRAKYPDYFISKNKVDLQKGMDVQAVLDEVEKEFSNNDLNKVDGLKIEFDKEWVHLRRSNTEPIIRIYAESSDRDNAEALASKVIKVIEAIAKKQIPAG
ncbi:MAG: phosphoglucosamine mutase [Bacteroidia bacterium]|nr:phosphoglucosamine mutase [Bacteroidia bacterium]